MAGECFDFLALIRNLRHESYETVSHVMKKIASFLEISMTPRGSSWFVNGSVSLRIHSGPGYKMIK